MILIGINSIYFSQDEMTKKGMNLINLNLLVLISLTIVPYSTFKFWNYIDYNGLVIHTLIGCLTIILLIIRYNIYI